MDIYHDKYIKYKNKYLMLKQEINDIQLNQNTGGGFFHERNQERRVENKKMLGFKSINIKIELEQNTPLYNYFNENKNKINFVNKIELQYLFHITLLNFEINMDHPLNTTGNNRRFELNNFVYKNGTNKLITNKFKTFIQSIGLKNIFYRYFFGTEFESTKYDILGKDDKFFVQSLDYNPKKISDGKYKISKFRTYFYNELSKYIQTIDADIESRFRTETKSIGGYNYTLIYFDKKLDKKSTSYDESEPLIAVPDFYWGNNVWTPHISLFKLDSSNLPTIQEVNNQILNTTYKKIKFILNDDNVNNVSVE